MQESNEDLTRDHSIPIEHSSQGFFAQPIPVLAAFASMTSVLLGRIAETIRHLATPAVDVCKCYAVMRQLINRLKTFLHNN